MATNLIEAISIQDDDYISIKFETSLRKASITDERFKLRVSGATPGDYIANAFYPIDLEHDYNALSKLLTLNFNPGILDPETVYVLEISGLQNAIGVTLPSVEFQFTTDAVFEDEYTRPSDPDVIIENKSIRDSTFISTGSVEVVDGTTEDQFGVLSVYPLDNSIYLSEDENNGVIEVTFSGRVPESQLSYTYFKTQKKAIKRGPTRWETVSPQIDQDDDRAVVYIKLPSTDATPTFGEAGKTYFEPGYKYRVILSKRLLISE